MTTEAKRRLTDISFEHEGAHVALVSIHQGGPANGVTTLITKATNNIGSEELEKALHESSNKKHNGDSQMETIEKALHEVLLTKAVDDAVAIEKAAGDARVAEVQKSLDAQVELLKAAQAKIEAFEAVAATAKVEARKAALVSAKVSADKVESVLKSLEVLSDEAFDAQVELLKSMSAAVDNSEMMQEAGVAGAGAESKEEVDRTTEILKQRYGIN